jgi:prephenate dehydrogenase
LIGGSAGIAWRAAGHTVVGYARRAETRRLARDLGAADETPETLAAAARADVVVLAPPPLAMRSVLSALAPHLAPRTVVADVGSTKQTIEGWARDALPAGVHFVGSHPMAGKETAGIEHADGGLFRGRTWVIVPPEGAPPAAVDAVTQLAHDAGARTVQMDAAAHDAAVAAVSHLPLVVAAALADAVIARDAFDDIAALAAGYLRDPTRPASGDPIMHRDICVTNREQVLAELERFSAALATLTDRIRRLPDPAAAGDSEAGDDAVRGLEHFFARTKRARDTWLRDSPVGHEERSRQAQ